MHGSTVVAMSHEVHRTCCSLNTLTHSPAASSGPTHMHGHGGNSARCETQPNIINLGPLTPSHAATRRTFLHRHTLTLDHSLVSRTSHPAEPLACRLCRPDQCSLLATARSDAAMGHVPQAAALAPCCCSRCLRPRQRLLLLHLLLLLRTLRVPHQFHCLQLWATPTPP